MSRWGQGLRWLRYSDRYARDVKIYHALIGEPKDSHAKRVSIEALDLVEAKAKLETQFGIGRVVSLWVDAEWQLPRGKW